MASNARLSKKIYKEHDNGDSYATAGRRHNRSTTEAASMARGYAASRNRR